MNNDMELGDVSLLAQISPKSAWDYDDALYTNLIVENITKYFSYLIIPHIIIPYYSTCCPMGLFSRKLDIGDFQKLACY